MGIKPQTQGMYEKGITLLNENDETKGVHGGGGERLYKPGQTRPLKKFGVRVRGSKEAGMGENAIE